MIGHDLHEEREWVDTHFMPRRARYARPKRTKPPMPWRAWVFMAVFAAWVVSIVIK